MKNEQKISAGACQIIRYKAVEAGRLNVGEFVESLRRLSLSAVLRDSWLISVRRFCCSDRFDLFRLESSSQQLRGNKEEQPSVKGLYYRMQLHEKLRLLENQDVDTWRPLPSHLAATWSTT